MGTSAGSFVAALAANGVTPEEMMRVVNRQVPTPFRDIDRATLMRPNTLEFAQSAGAAAAADARAGAQPGRPASAQTSIVDLGVGLAEGLPSGLYDGRGIEHYIARCSAIPTAPTTSACSSASST